MTSKFIPPTPTSTKPVEALHLSISQVSQIQCVQSLTVCVCPQTTLPNLHKWRFNSSITYTKIPGFLLNSLSSLLWISNPSTNPVGYDSEPPTLLSPLCMPVQLPLHLPSHPVSQLPPLAPSPSILQAAICRVFLKYESDHAIISLKPPQGLPLILGKKKSNFMPMARETQEDQTLPGSPASLDPHLLPSVLSSLGAHFSDFPSASPPPSLCIYCSLHQNVLLLPKVPHILLRIRLSHPSLISLIVTSSRTFISMLTLPEFSYIYLFFVDKYHWLIQSSIVGHLGCFQL